MLQNWWSRRRGGLTYLFDSTSSPLDLELVGKALLHAALVGAVAGLFGALFFGALEFIQRFLLGDIAGYILLRAHGERFAAAANLHTFRPWLLMVLPALGGLLCGLATGLAPETRGGGGDAMIDAFHRDNGIIRQRVIWIKALASTFTLGTGGAGGREGPTMQIGAALGSVVGRYLRVDARERRILMIAGVAAGLSAVFRTPLGAALLAVEVLYRDGFESDALIPSVLASVVSYSVVISIYGESTLFAHAARFPFLPSHLPLYGALALLEAALATGFVTALRGVQSASRKTIRRAWLRPAIGGLALGLFATPVILFVGWRIQAPGQGLGILGSGYGAVQMAISGSEWLPQGWEAVAILLLLSGAKLIAASLTIGSGGSGGDFAPSLVIGGLFGGAFGRAAQLLFQDGRIDPGAFALVGMGAFYGGIAHVPLSALVLVCEMAGNYDLLVPLMLAEGIAYVALRKRTLYHAQVPTQRDSPVHREALITGLLKAFFVKDVLAPERTHQSFSLGSRAAEMVDRAKDATWQKVFPIIEGDGALVGVVTVDALRVLETDPDATSWMVAADVLQPPVFVHSEDNLSLAVETLVASGLPQVPVLSVAERVVGLLDISDIAKLHLAPKVETPAPA